MRARHDERIVSEQSDSAGRQSGMIHAAGRLSLAVPLFVIATVVAACVASAPVATGVHPSVSGQSEPLARSPGRPSPQASPGLVPRDAPAAGTSGPIRSTRLTASPRPDPTPPPWALDVVGELACGGAPQPIGAVVAEDSPGSSADRGAEGALDRWIADVAPFFVALPLSGFEELRRTEHFVLFAHVAHGGPKAVALATDIGNVPAPGNWTVTRFAACDAAEFDPGARLAHDIRIWSDGAGRVETTRLLERADCYGRAALRVETRLFVRDPTGNAFDPESLLTTYSANVALPKSARATDYREGGRRLHLAADGTAAFVESPSGVERWPRVRGDEYVRTDCN